MSLHTAGSQLFSSGNAESICPPSPEISSGINLHRAEGSVIFGPSVSMKRIGQIEVLVIKKSVEGAVVYIPRGAYGRRNPAHLYLRLAMRSSCHTAV
jgi:hypothetical protein